ncbi:MAG: right-handed parallel beta-helix repeat-containing protein [Fidelibacterota bacterium]|nr:MAG: right-handed parallel beta-helix repeat-containing protein [Candidatus Neomarinimicrobiota bacterium]
MKKSILIKTALILFAFGVQGVLAQFEVGKQFFSPTYDNQTVVLTEDYTTDDVSKPQCFEIAAENFTLDGAGHTLRGGGSGGGDHVGCKPRDCIPNITIKNLRMTNWGVGIYGPGWCDGLLDSCMIDSNDGWGYQVGRDKNENTELRNSTFKDNRGRAMKLSRVQNIYVHDNEIIHNGYNDKDPPTTGGGIDVFTSLSRNNRIENNLFENNKDYGLHIYGGDLGMPKLTLVKGNLFKNNGVIVEDSDSNTFIDNTFDGSTSTIVVSGGIENVFIDCGFVGWTALDLTVNSGAKVTFIGTSFEGASVVVSDAGSELTVKWHVSATVTDGDAVVEGAAVKFYDKDQTLVAQDTTDAEGKIDTLDLVAYVQDETEKTYATPHSMVVTKDGNEIYSTTVDLTENTHLTTTETAIRETMRGGIPAEFALDQNHPNPFNPETHIYYQLPRSSTLSLRIYDIQGRLVRTLVEGYQNPGYHTIVWDSRDDRGRAVASGVYLYIMAADEFREAHRMVLLR